MNRHYSTTAEAGRLARRAALLRVTETRLANLGKASAAVEVAREASRCEQRALRLAGYQEARR